MIVMKAMGTTSGINGAKNDATRVVFA